MHIQGKALKRILSAPLLPFSPLAIGHYCCNKQSFKRQKFFMVLAGLQLHEDLHPSLGWEPVHLLRDPVICSYMNAMGHRNQETFKECRLDFLFTITYHKIPM